MDLIIILEMLIAFGAGCFGTWFYHRRRTGGLQELAQEILHQAEIDGETLRRESEQAIRQAEKAHEEELEQQRITANKSLKHEEERLKNRQDTLEKRISSFEKMRADLELREAAIAKSTQELEREKTAITTLKKQKILALEQTSKLSQKEAKETLLKEIYKQVQSDAAQITIQATEEAQEQAQRQAQTIIATAINRLAVCQSSDATVSTLTLPNEEIKARIVGREGRNIRALEQATGVNFILDETPGMITISGFDPLRKQIAKTALKELILDGRIHPSSIELAVEKAHKNVEKQIIQIGSEATQRCGCPDVHKEIIKLLGQLSLRRSYGQNLLDHSIEVSYLLGMMTEELGLDSQLGRKIGLLHDIGKAVSHQTDGTHALIGMALATKYGESDEVSNGIGCHHGEVDPITIEGSLCGAADALSAARPGARIEAVNEYIKRLRKLEEIAFEFPAVEHAYALQAGRELRISVLPDMIDDAGSINLARDLTHAIQQRIRYSGKIKVMVIREKRVVNYAL